MNLKFYLMNNTSHFVYFQQQAVKDWMKKYAVKKPPQNPWWTNITSTIQVTKDEEIIYTTG